MMANYSTLLICVCGLLASPILEFCAASETEQVVDEYLLYTREGMLPSGGLSERVHKLDKVELKAVLLDRVAKVTTGADLYNLGKLSYVIKDQEFRRHLYRLATQRVMTEDFDPWTYGVIVESFLERATLDDKEMLAELARSSPNESVRKLAGNTLNKLDQSVQGEDLTRKDGQESTDSRSDSSRTGGENGYKEDGNWTLPAIIGIALFGVLILCGGFLFLRNRP